MLWHVVPDGWSPQPQKATSTLKSQKIKFSSNLPKKSVNLSPSCVALDCLEVYEKFLWWVGGLFNIPTTMLH